MNCPIAKLPYEEFQKWFLEQSIRQRAADIKDCNESLFHHMFCDECRKRMLECK